MDPKPIEIPGTSITGQPLKNGKVNVRFTLLSKSGSVDYEEFHQATTDEYGLINLTIGNGLIGSASGLSTQATTATYRTFDAIKWDANVKQLRVDLSFDAGKNFSTASVQPFNYTAYALYAESVEYKNVRDTPTTLSYFNNDVGYIVNKDLDPIKNEIDQNQKDAISKFLIVNQAISDNEKVIAQTNQKLGDISVTVTNQGNQITNQGNQITNVSNQMVITQAKVEAVVNSYENLGNKSTSVQSDRNSNDKYPSVKAVKEYVDQATLGIALQTTVDGKEDKQNKSVNIKTDKNPNVNYPTVAAVKQFVTEAALSSDVQLIIDGKEDVANKSTNVVTDGTSNDKYPTVKAIKDYVDETTLGKSLAADISAKEEKSNKTDVIKQDETNANLFPSVLAVKKFVNDATINSLTVEKQAIALNDAKNVISLTGGETPSSITLPNASSTLAGLVQLKGDLGGTSDNPTVPGLANKENSANKTDEIKVDETNVNLFPTVLAVRKFVNDATINSLTVEKQSISLNDAKNVITLAGGEKSSSITLPNATSTDAGLIQLKGDLSGTYDAPEVKTDAITTAKILNENVTDAKIKSVSASKLTGELSLVNGGTGASSKAGARENLEINLVDNTSDANKPISIAAQSEFDKKESLSNKTNDFVKYADSDEKYPTIKSVKSYIDTKSTSNEGLVEAEKVRAMLAEDTKEDLANKSKNVTTDKDSDDKYPTVKSVKTYVDAQTSNTESLVKAEETRALAKEALKEDLVNKSKNVLEDKDSDIKYPTVKSLVDYATSLVKSGDDDTKDEIEKEKQRAIGRENGLGDEISAEKKRSSDKDTEHESAIAATSNLVNSNKTSQDAKNTELEGKLSNHASALATEKSDRESAINAEKLARETAISSESAARVAGIATEKSDREAAMLAAKNAQDTKNADLDSKIATHESTISSNKLAQDAKNTEFDGKFTNQASALASEKSDREAAISAERTARESAISTESAARLAGIAAEKSAREAAMLAAKNTQDSKNAEIDGRLANQAADISTHSAAIATNAASILSNKNTQDSKNTEIEGRLTSQASDIASHATTIASNSAAILANKNSQDTKNAALDALLVTQGNTIANNKSAQESKNTVFEGRLASHASEIASQGSAIASNTAEISANKSAQDAKNTTIENQLSAQGSVIANNKSTQDAKNTEIEGRLTSHAADILTQGSTIAANTSAINSNKSSQDAKNLAIDASLSSHAASIADNNAAIAAHEAKLATNSASINANANAILAEVNTRETEIAKESAARLALSKKVDASLSTLQTTLSAGVSTIGSTLTSGNIIVGDASNVAAAVAMSGDVTINEAGITTIGSNAIGSTEIINGTVTNEDLVNKSVSIGSTTLDLGASTTTLTGLTSVSATNFTGALTGNASTATKLANAKTIGMTGDVTWTSSAFDGSDHVSGVATIGTGKVTNGMLAGGIDLTSKVTGILPLANLPADLTARVSIANTNTNGLLASTDWNTFNAKQNAITLNSTGSSGAATLTGSTLNIPNYSLGNSAGFTGNLAGDVSGTQNATIVTKINGVSLAGLGTGILKNTTGTGIPTIAEAADFPILNQNTTGSAATAIAALTQALGDSSTKIATTEFVAKGLVIKTSKSYVDNALLAKANLVSPTFTGFPLAPTALATDSSNVIASTAFVKSLIASKTNKAYVDGVNALKANLTSPTFIGVPSAPTAASNDSSATIATTKFVKDGLASKVSKAYVDNSVALRATLASPVFTGIPSLPTGTIAVTQNSGDSTSSVASTLFVTRGLAAKVNKAYVDNSISTKAPLASPTFTGLPAAPTAALGTNTTQVATTAFVKSTVDAAISSASGITQVANDNSTKLATTAYVDNADATKAPLASPALTGIPTAPTAASGTSTTQIATTAYVANAVSAKASIDSPTFTGTPALPTGTTGITQAANDNSTKLSTTAYVDRAVTTNTAYTTSVGTAGSVLIKTAAGAVWATEFAEIINPTKSGSNYVVTLSKTPIAGTIIKVYDLNGAKVRQSTISVSGTQVTISGLGSSNSTTVEVTYYQ